MPDFDMNRFWRAMNGPPSYAERFVQSQQDAIAAVKPKEEPEAAPSSYPFTDQERKRLEFYKWLLQQGRLSDWPAE